jgi:hypothetical protein
MKRFYIGLFLMTCFQVTICTAQENKKDSLAMTSREKADKVLSLFDTITAQKLLYSIEDTEYYLIINYKSYVKEYYIVSNESEYIVYRVKKALIKKRRKQETEWKKMFTAANPFDLSKYHTDYITQLPKDSEYLTFGRLTYFVIKDIDGKRYGEFHLFMPTSPLLIDPNLWAYIIMKLSATKKQKL